ncbi:MAG TPA: hypothetical protein VL651_10355 [Bacteroidia bacterium]|jgi:hypothetical protein|nr:hypothetical protein [Bacteroidia bacterium]
MKKTILLSSIALVTLLSSCGGADEMAKQLRDSVIKDSTDKAVRQKNSEDSLKMSDSINSASMKMKAQMKLDSTHRADSLAKAGKKGK